MDLLHVPKLYSAQIRKPALFKIQVPSLPRRACCNGLPTWPLCIASCLPVHTVSCHPHPTSALVPCFLVRSASAAPWISITTATSLAPASEAGESEGTSCPFACCSRACQSASSPALPPSSAVVSCLSTPRSRRQTPPVSWPCRGRGNQRRGWPSYSVAWSPYLGFWPLAYGW